MSENTSMAIPANDNPLLALGRGDADVMRARSRASGGEKHGKDLPISLAADDVLVAHARLGEADAFEVLVTRYQDRLYSIIYGLVSDPDDSLDLVQDTLLKAYQGLGSFRGGSSFYTWLYRIAVNNCKDFIRRRAVRSSLSLEDDQLQELGFEPAASSEFNPADAMESKELRVMVRMAVDKLPEKLRLAVVLHDIQGLPQREVAAILRCPVGTVKSHVFRGRARLRKMLGRYVEGEG